MTFRNSSHTILKTVDYSYDVFNRLVHRAYDADGPGGNAAVDRFFAGYVGIEPSFIFDGSELEDLTHRLLWGPAVDMLLADEQIADPENAGNTLWMLGDHLGTLRDIADFDTGTQVYTITNHRVYDSFGNLTNQTNGSVHVDFAYTGKFFDGVTGLSHHWNRWYDPALGKWISEDPIGFAAGDANLSRYVGNDAVNFFDPTGLLQDPVQDGQTAGRVAIPDDVVERAREKKVDEAMGALAVFAAQYPDHFDALIEKYGDDPEVIGNLITVLSWGYPTLMGENRLSFWWWNIKTYDGITYLVIDNNNNWLPLQGTNSVEDDVVVLERALREGLAKGRFKQPKGGLDGLSVGDMMAWHGRHSIHVSARNVGHVMRQFGEEVSGQIGTDLALNAAGVGMAKVAAALPFLFNSSSRGFWSLTIEGASRVMVHERFGKFYKSKSDGLWWAVDRAAHGGSAYKVFKESGSGLKWIADADVYGDFIAGKHKGPTGLTIPWKELIGISK